MRSLILTASALIAFTATTALMYKYGTRRGKRKAIEVLRKDQLDMTKEELFDKIKNNPSNEAVYTEWYTKETRIINSMYDDILKEISTS